MVQSLPEDKPASWHQSKCILGSSGEKRDGVSSWERLAEALTSSWEPVLGEERRCPRV